MVTIALEATLQRSATRVFFFFTVLITSGRASCSTKLGQSTMNCLIASDNQCERWTQVLTNFNKTLQQNLSEYAERYNNIVFQQENVYKNGTKPLKKSVEALPWDICPIR